MISWGQGSFAIFFGGWVGQRLFETFSENSSFYAKQGFPYQASIWVKDEEGAEDDVEEEVDQVDVGGGAPDVDQHLYDDMINVT